MGRANNPVPEAKTIIHPVDDSAIEKARLRILSGDLVAFPTETVYGLGADATNSRAVAGIFAAKNRPSFNPLIVHFADQKAAAREVTFTPLAEKLAAQFWPGALTLVLEKRADSGLSDLVSAGLSTVAVRLPDHPVAKALLASLPCPLAAPSANRSESISPTQANHVLESLGNDCPMVLDGGPCRMGLESTVVDARGNSPILLRPGGITLEDLQDCVGPVALGLEPDDTEKPSSPGQLLRHYAPSIPLEMNCRTPKAGWAILGFGADIAELATLNLSESGNLTEAAANLFAMLRKLDCGSFDGIAVAPIPMDGLGMAINDRLNRAAKRP